MSLWQRIENDNAIGGDGSWSVGTLAEEIASAEIMAKCAARSAATAELTGNREDAAIWRGQEAWWKREAVRLAHANTTS